MKWTWSSERYPWQTLMLFSFFVFSPKVSLSRWGRSTRSFLTSTDTKWEAWTGVRVRKEPVSDRKCPWIVLQSHISPLKVSSVLLELAAGDGVHLLREMSAGLNWGPNTTVGPGCQRVFLWFRSLPGIPDRWPDSYSYCYLLTCLEENPFSFCKWAKERPNTGKLNGKIHWSLYLQSPQGHQDFIQIVFLLSLLGSR